MRGRKPKPIERRKAEGNPGHRPVGQVLAVAHLRPEIPKTVSAAARAFLEPVLAELERTGILTIIDGPSLIAMAETHVELNWWRRQLAVAMKKKPVDREAVGDIQREVRRADDAFRKWASEYGLTSVSRTRIGAGDRGPADPGDESDLD